MTLSADSPPCLDQLTCLNAPWDLETWTFFGGLPELVVASTVFLNLCARLCFNEGLPSPPTENFCFTRLLVRLSQTSPLVCWKKLLSSLQSRHSPLQDLEWAEVGVKDWKLQKKFHLASWIFSFIFFDLIQEFLFQNSNIPLASNWPRVSGQRLSIIHYELWEAVTGWMSWFHHLFQTTDHQHLHHHLQHWL